ncbi:MAG: hypothetical protein ACFFDF_02695 [Candidatus Odinarchaeota archaeon]
MTSIVFQTSPIIYYNLNIDRFTSIFLIWTGEVEVYLILAKIEDYTLRAKYKDEFLECVNDVI